MLFRSMSASDIQAKITEAVALHEAGDTAGALDKLRSARMLIAAQPRVRSRDGEEIEYKVDDIDHMIADMRGAGSSVSATSIQRQTITYVRPGGCAE